MAAASFVAGRLFVQSENIISKKREVYQAYLDKCLTAHDAYKQGSQDEIDFDDLKPSGDFFLYASQEVIVLVGLHVDSLNEAFDQIDNDTDALHPAFKTSITKYNSVLAAMRRDVLAWSIHGIYEKMFGDKRARKLLNDSTK